MAHRPHYLFIKQIRLTPRLKKHLSFFQIEYIESAEFVEDYF